MSRTLIVSMVETITGAAWAEGSKDPFSAVGRDLAERSSGGWESVGRGLYAPTGWSRSKVGRAARRGARLT